MLRNEDQVFLGQCLMLYRVAPQKLDARFLLYSFQADDLQGQIKGLGSGATVEHMWVADALNLTILLPPLPTQRKIASILSAYDDLIENNTRRIKILEEMAQSLYREWFVNFRFPGHESVRMVDSELGPVPEGWEVVKLFDAAEVPYGFPFQSKLFTDLQVGKQVIRIRDIKAGMSKTFTSEEVADKYLVHNGDLVVGMDGDFHMPIRSGGEAYLNQRVVRFRPKADLARYYLFLALKDPIKHFDETVVGTTVAHLSDEDLRSISILLPEVNVRNHAGTILDPLFDLQLSLRARVEME